MGTYVHKFATQADFNAAYQGNNYAEPWVSAIDNGPMGYNKWSESCGYEYVDLGLQSGALWATMNVGATALTDVGTYFSWGEVSGKTRYGMDNYLYGQYDYISAYKSDDGLLNLRKSDDAATKNMGPMWRTPSPRDFVELSGGTTAGQHTISGVTGTLFVSKSNGNSLFIPYAMFKSDNGDSYEGSSIIWLNRAGWEYSGYDLCAFFGVCGAATDGYPGLNMDGSVWRYVGAPVRGVIGGSNGMPLG